VEYSCDVGYAFNGDPATPSFPRTCQPSGQLTAELQCTPVVCPDPPAIPQANRLQVFEGEAFTYPGLIRYLCAEGFTVDGRGSSATMTTLQCKFNAQWGYLDEGASSDLEDFLLYGCRKWEVGQWGECQATCGKGSYSRSVSCEPEGAVCNAATKPQSEAECFGVGGCPDCGPAPEVPHAGVQGGGAPVVQTNGDAIFYNCDKHDSYSLEGTLGLSSVKTTFQLHCVIDEAQQSAVMQFTRLSGAPMPFEEMTQKGCRRWETTEWGDCSVSCGAGNQFRQVKCSTDEDADCDIDAKPQGVILSKPCFDPAECSSVGRNTDSNNFGRPALGEPRLVSLLSIAAVAGLLWHAA